MKDGNNPGQEKADARKKENIVKVLISLIAQVYHLVLGHGDEVLAVTKKGKVLELFSRGFRNHCEIAWFKNIKTLFPIKAFTQALMTVRQTTLEKAKQVRLVNDNYCWDNSGAYFKNDGGQQIQVSVEGVAEISVIQSPVVFTGDHRPFVKFIAPADTLTELLRDTVRLADDQFMLFIGCLLKAFLPGPNPVMIFASEQSSGKTFLANIFKMIVDPDGTSERVRILDNISSIGDRLSDSLCRESHDRLLIATTIADDLMLNQDLVDRTIVFHLPPIPANERRPESMLLGKIMENLGAIMHVIALALSEIAKNNHTMRDSYPRLADFTHYCMAAASSCPSLGFNDREFFAALVNNRGYAVERSLNDNPVSAAIIDFMDGLEDDSWSGTATELQEILAKKVAPEIRSHSNWPAKANKLSGKLRRATPFLRTIGLDIAWDKSGQRSITIEKIAVPENESPLAYCNNDSTPPVPSTTAGDGESSPEVRDSSLPAGISSTESSETHAVA